MKSAAVRHQHPPPGNRSVRSGRSYAGRRTLERIYRRIASSNVVGTLSRVGRSNRRRGIRADPSEDIRHHPQPKLGGIKTSWNHTSVTVPGSSSYGLQHPQSSVIQKRAKHLSQLKLERSKSRRRAREQKLKRVWENDVLSSGSEEAINEDPLAHHSAGSRLARSLAQIDAVASSSEEVTSGSEVITDDGSHQYLASPRGSSKNSGRGGCTSAGYIPQLLCSVILSMGNLNIGFSLAYHALAPANQLPPDAPAWLLPWTQNLFNLGGLFGGLLSAFALSKGRKRPLIFFVLVSTGSWLMVILAEASSMVFGSRLIAGVTAGVVTVVNQVYIAEIVSPLNRGGFGVLPTIFSLLGTLSCFGLSYIAPWNTISITGASLNAPYLILMLFYLPESTRFLIKAGRIQAAVGTMAKFGTTNQLASIRDAVELFKIGGNYSLFGKAFLIPVIISSGLMFFSQFAGVDGVMTYAADRFQFQDPSGFLPNNLPIVVLYGVQLVAALICFVCVDRQGRRSLLLISTATAAIALLALGLYLLFEDIGWGLGMRWIPMSCVILYSGAFALGLGPIPWLILGEFSPRKNQGAAGALAATCFWGPSLIITASFGDMQSAMYLSGTFWFYTIFCVFGYLFVLLVLPDLKTDATIEQIQLFFQAKADQADAKKNQELEDPWSFSAP